jgi:hypothetical protein
VTRELSVRCNSWNRFRERLRKRKLTERAFQLPSPLFRR